MPTVSVHCYKCYGVGQIRKRNMIGVTSFDLCKKCRGLGRVHAEWGSGEHRIAANIAAVGLGPGIKKGVNRDVQHDIKG